MSNLVGVPEQPSAHGLHKLGSWSIFYDQRRRHRQRW